MKSGINYEVMDEYKLILLPISASRASKIKDGKQAKLENRLLTDWLLVGL